MDWSGRGGLRTGAIRTSIWSTTGFIATNAYHSTGSRFCRLRTEYQSRVRLLQALIMRPGYFDPSRSFAKDYLELLVGTGAGGFSWSLWHFYWKNAGLFFGAGRQLSGFTCRREPVTIGADDVKSRCRPAVKNQPAVDPRRTGAGPAIAKDGLRLADLFEVRAFGLMATWSRIDGGIGEAEERKDQPTQGGDRSPNQQPLCPTA